MSWPRLKGSIAPARIAELVAKPDAVVLDVGCNDGEHTRMFLDLFPRGRVHAFEPDERARARFLAEMDKFSRFRKAANWTLYHIALGAEDGLIDFHASYGDGKDAPSKEWDCSGSIRRPKGHLRRYPWCGFKPPVKIRASRLDTWAREWVPEGETIDFVWADVQGAEGDLIGGGRETLARTRFLYTEYSDQELYEGQPTLAHLAALLPDYEIVEQYPDDVLMRNRRC